MALIQSLNFIGRFLVNNILISVVIPVYMAAECLSELHRRLTLSLSSITNNYEIIFVEDCGTDESWNIIKLLSQQDSRVIGIQLSRNFGQHCAITAGLDKSSGTWVVVMDCDLQDQPEEIVGMYEYAIVGNFDVVFALRGRRADSYLKRITSSFFYVVFRYFSGINYSGNSANFSILKRVVVNEFCKMREQLRFFGGLIQWMGFSVGYKQVQHAPRFKGKSSYSYGRLLTLAVSTIIAYSDKPLRIAINVGFIMATISFCFGLYILFQALYFGSKIQGWPSLIVSLFFIGGLIISILGVIGIYLGKTFDEVKKRPLYIVRQEVRRS